MKKQLLVTLGSISLALATQAATFTFQENGSNKDLTPSSTFTESGLSITASGFATAGGTADLYSKFTSGNPGETGLGMANDIPDHEIDTTHFIQLDFSAVIPASSVTITISSIQGPPDPDETAVVYATKTPGSLAGAIKIATLDGTVGLVQTVDVTPYVNSGYFIDVTASAENVLIETVSVQPGQPLTGGDTATIGFWHNKNGQALIKSLNGGPASTALGTWLAGNFPCLFGTLNGQANTVVAARFLTYFNVTGQKTYAQIMAVALASYATSSTLAGGTMAASYGFNVSAGGTGDKLFNVGPYGSAIGLLNNTSYTVMQLLEAANANCSAGITPAAFNALNNIFDGINTGGDI